MKFAACRVVLFIRMGVGEGAFQTWCLCLHFLTPRKTWNLEVSGGNWRESLKQWSVRLE